MKTEYNYYVLRKIAQELVDAERDSAEEYFQWREALGRGENKSDPDAFKKRYEDTGQLQRLESKRSNAYISLRSFLATNKDDVPGAGQGGG